MALARALVVFLTFFAASKAFFSSAVLELDRESALKTLDHAIITKIGLLRFLVEFLKDSPQYIDEEMAAKFEDLQRMVITVGTPDNIQNLFSVMLPRMRLQNAIAEIQSSNAQVNTAPLKSVAAAHFSGEQFKEGSKRLLELKSQIVTSLLKGVKFEYARQVAGQYLHTLQDFYSHSNWVELQNGVRKFDALTNPGNSIPSQYVARPNEETCFSCPLAITDNCENNLIIQKLTSGYYGGQDISKPTNVSKCGHGGILDSTRNQGTRGGINKEAATRKWSPHYKLHTVAAEHAIEASKQFFEDLRTTVGDDIFARFLDLQAVRTLALVIDDTGSMGEEIKSVKKLSIDFVQNSNSPAGNTAFVYILVPFNDPRVGPVTVTSNPEEVIRAVNSLKANRGGDCPELGMTGLYQALLQSVEDSAIYFFSDADAKDLILAQVVLILAKQKRVRINFILSGRCSYRRKRRSSMVEADLGSQHLYQYLASATGGQLLRTKKNKVSVLVDIIGSKSSGGDSRDLAEVNKLICNVRTNR